MRKSVKDQLEFLAIYFSLESNYAPSSAVGEPFFFLIFFFNHNKKEKLALNNSQWPIVGFQKCQPTTLMRFLWRFYYGDNNITTANVVHCFCFQWHVFTRRRGWTVITVKGGKNGFRLQSSNGHLRSFDCTTVITPRICFLLQHILLSSVAPY